MKQRNETFGTFDCNLALLRKNLRTVKTRGWTRSCTIFRNLLDSDKVSYNHHGYYVFHNRGQGNVVDKICYLLDFGPYDRVVLFAVQQDLKLRSVADVCGFIGALDVYLTAYGKMNHVISAGWRGIKGNAVKTGVDINAFDKKLPNYAVEMMESFFNDGGDSVYYGLSEEDVSSSALSGMPIFATCSCLMSGHTGEVHHVCGK